ASHLASWFREGVFSHRISSGAEASSRRQTPRQLPAAELTEPSRGLAFVVALDKVVGVSHLRNEQSPDQPS
ncbi:MAG TPA: hypothetical protein VIG36_12350, partial [Methylocystis sp.]